MADQSLQFEGRAVPIKPGDRVASALYRSGIRSFDEATDSHLPDDYLLAAQN
jgi:hypothetical protein